MKASQNPKGMSRRKFMAFAGGAAGLAAMAAMGLSLSREECSANIPEIDIDKMAYAESETDVLVVGSGIAGLFAAVKGHDAGARVLMVSKGRLGSSGQTPFAKGIFAYDSTREKLSLDAFVDKVSRSAMGTNNPVFTRQMAEHSLARVNELKAWGFFDSPLYFNAFSKPITERNIPVIERVMVTHLIKEDGRIAGAAGFSIDEAKIYIFKARSVVLCSGAGGFKPNGFPICDLTHDGTVMAYHIGAKVTGKGASNIPGLYAAGDALGSHMAGAIYTQVGSSLAGSAVQGAIVSEAAAEYAKGVEFARISNTRIKVIEEEILAPLKRNAGYGPAWVTRTLQGIMIPNFVLYIKKESLLKAALAYVEELRDHHMPMLRAADLHELRLAHETANMIVNA